MSASDNITGRNQTATMDKKAWGRPPSCGHGYPSLPPSLRAQSHHGSSGRGSTTWEQEQGDQKLPWPDGPWNWPNQLWVWRRGADSSTARLPPATSSAAQSLSQCSIRIKRRVKKRKLSYNQPASKTRTQEGDHHMLTENNRSSDERFQMCSFIKHLEWLVSHYCEFLI